MNAMPPVPRLSVSPKITAKGQITLRRGLLDHIGARPGDRLEIVPTAAGTLEIRREAKGSWAAFFGSMKSDMPALTIEEMNDVIAAAAAGELDACD